MSGKGADRVMARDLANAGNVVSGLDLSGIGEDGHVLASRLWKVAAYLRLRNDPEAAETGNPAAERAFPQGADASETGDLPVCACKCHTSKGRRWSLCLKCGRYAGIIRG